jgi:hypothetical protein
MGIVSEIKTAYSEQFKNISVNITDGTNTVYCYRLAANVVVGDVIVVTGKVGSYEGAKQIAAGATAVIIQKAPEKEEEAIAGEKLTIAASTGTLSTDKKSITWNSDNYTITNNQGASTSAIRTSDTDHFRVYAKSDFAVSAKNDKKIVKLTIVCQNASYADAAVKSLTTAGATATAADNVVTIVAEAGVAAIEFTASAQFRVTDFYVVFA